jgi:hypothetical protein
MSWNEIMSQTETKFVTKRYRVTEQQDNVLKEIEKELKIPPSAMVRLFINICLPKIRDENFKYEGIKRLWNENKF